MSDWIRDASNEILAEFDIGTTVGDHIGAIIEKHWERRIMGARVVTAGGLLDQAAGRQKQLEAAIHKLIAAYWSLADTDEYCAFCKTGDGLEELEEFDSALADLEQAVGPEPRSDGKPTI